jgi:hypothetical protein
LICAIRAFAFWRLGDLALNSDLSLLRLFVAKSCRVAQAFRLRAKGNFPTSEKI